MHVHLLLHLHWTASMIAHVWRTHPFTVGYLDPGCDHVREGVCRIR